MGVTFDRSPAAMRALGRLPKRKYDWPRLSELYVQGEIVDGERVWQSTDAIAHAEGIVPERVRRACARDGWVKQRQRFRAELTRAARKAAQELAVGQVVDLDTEVIDGAYRGVRLVTARIAEIEDAVDAQEVARAAYQALVATGASADELAATGHDPWQASVVYAREIQALAVAVQALHATAHRAVGDVDMRRLEFNGPGGTAIEVDHTVHAELTRPDPERLLRLFQAAARATFGQPEEIERERGHVVNADVVED